MSEPNNGGSGPVPSTPSERPVLVCGTAGGVGTSVVSALLADHRAATTLGEASWWGDLAGNDSDIGERMCVDADPMLPRSSLGAGHWRVPADRNVTEAIVYARQCGAVPVVDAGSRPLSVLPHLSGVQLAGVTPVLVIGPRPDLLNRAREALGQWQRAGILQKTVVVINCQIPTLNHQALTEMLVGTISGQVAGVIGLDYDPVLGEGTALDWNAQEGLAPTTLLALQSLANATVDGHPGHQAVVH